MNAKIIIGVSAFSAGLFCCSSTVRAGDVYPVLKTLDGEVFTNAEISSHTPSYVVVMFDAGGKKVSFTNLPPEIQRKYGYNPTNAAAFDKVEADKRAKAIADNQAAMDAATEAAKDRSYRWVGDELVPISKFKKAWGNILQVLDNGILMRAQSMMDLGPPIVTATESVSYPEPRLVFVRCPVAGLSDGQRWEGYIYRHGEYKYDSTGGSSKTVEQYDTGLTYLNKSDVVLKLQRPN